MHGKRMTVSSRIDGFQFIEQKGALLYGSSPVCALCETEHPGHLNVRGVLRHCVPNKGLHPLRRESGYLLMAKGATTFELLPVKRTVKK